MDTEHLVIGLVDISCQWTELLVNSQTFYPLMWQLPLFYPLRNCLSSILWTKVFTSGLSLQIDQVSSIIHKSN